jgi:hypothetical protein
MGQGRGIDSRGQVAAGLDEDEAEAEGPLHALTLAGLTASRQASRQARQATAPNTDTVTSLTAETAAETAASASASEGEVTDDDEGRGVGGGDIGEEEEEEEEEAAAAVGIGLAMDEDDEEPFLDQGDARINVRVAVPFSSELADVNVNKLHYGRVMGCRPDKISVDGSIRDRGDVSVVFDDGDRCGLSAEEFDIASALAAHNPCLGERVNIDAVLGGAQPDALQQSALHQENPLKHLVDAVGSQDQEWDGSTLYFLKDSEEVGELVRGFAEGIGLVFQTQHVLGRSLQACVDQLCIEYFRLRLRAQEKAEIENSSLFLIQDDWSTFISAIAELGERGVVGDASRQAITALGRYVSEYFSSSFNLIGTNTVYPMAHGREYRKKANHVDLSTEDRVRSAFFDDVDVHAVIC